MRGLDFSSWHAFLPTLLSLAFITLIGVGIRLVVMQTIQIRREREALNNRVTRQYGTLFQNIDILITPTYAAPVPQANGTSSSLHDGDVHTWFSRQLDAARYAILANEVGAPALSLPSGLGDDGMPVGIQLCGSWNSESTLLHLAARIEQAKPEWFGCVPSIHVSNRLSASPAHP